MRTLYVEYFVPKSGGQVCTERHNELLQALQRNLEHPVVDKVVIFSDERVPFADTFAIPFEVIPSKRITFEGVFAYANARTGADDVHILCNTDIALVDGFDDIEQFLGPDDFFCLSRYELNGKISTHAHGSQDTWIWRGINRIRGVRFPLGIRGCDCHIIGAARRARYQVSNPSKTLCTIHFHASNLRATTYGDTKIPSPWFGVTPCNLGSAGEVCRFLGKDNWPTVTEPRPITRTVLRQRCGAALRA